MTRQQAKKITSQLMADLRACQAEGDQEQAYDLIEEAINDLAGSPGLDELRSGLECWIADNI